jgi:toxin ParE1/3/4
VKSKPLVRLASARDDEREAVRHYASEAGLDVALRFIEALRDAYISIAERPKTGSPRYGELLGLKGLRTKKLRNFPFAVFYAERADSIDVWRVLHAQRDGMSVLPSRGDPV